MVFRKDMGVSRLAARQSGAVGNGGHHRGNVGSVVVVVGCPTMVSLAAKACSAGADWNLATTV